MKQLFKSAVNCPACSRQKQGPAPVLETASFKAVITSDTRLRPVTLPLAALLFLPEVSPAAPPAPGFPVTPTAAATSPARKLIDIDRSANPVRMSVAVPCSIAGSRMVMEQQCSRAKWGQAQAKRGGRARAMCHTWTSPLASSAKRRALVRLRVGRKEQQG